MPKIIPHIVTVIIYAAVVLAAGAAVSAACQARNPAALRARQFQLVSDLIDRRMAELDAARKERDDLRAQLEACRRQGGCPCP